MTDKKISLQLNPKVLYQEWEKYVFNHPEGTFYHLPAWKEVLEKSFGFQPFYIFAYDNQKKICGILPLFQIKSFFGGKRLVSLPFSYLGGPIADNYQIEKTLLHESKKILLKNNANYLEIRKLKQIKINWPLNNYFLTYQLKINRDIKDIWKVLEKNVRWAINRAKKDNIIIIKKNNLEGLRIFDRLNQMNKKRLGTPSHPFYFLKNFYELFPKIMNIYLARVGENYIAAAIFLFYKGKIIYKYGASDNKYLKYQPNNLLIWQAIEDGHQQKYQIFDFGRTASDNLGLRNFKKRWGGEEQKLHYYYYPREVHKLSNKRSSLQYKIITNLCRALPLPIIRFLGNNLFKYLD